MLFRDSKRKKKSFLVTVNLGTVGAMDLGGASTQIAVEVPEGHVITTTMDTGDTNEDWDPLFKNDHISDVELYGQNYTVFTQSSLCYGIMEVIRRYEYILVNVIPTISFPININLLIISLFIDIFIVE